MASDAKKKDPLAEVPIERQGVVEGVGVVELERPRQATVMVGGVPYHHKTEDAAGRWVYAAW